MGRVYGNNEILKEVLAAHDDEIDYSQYDSDKDGYIDAIYILYAGEHGQWADFYWSYKTSAILTEDMVYDNVQPMGYVFEHTQAGVIQTTIHESGHLMGLPDYYNYNAEANEVEFFGEIGGLGMFDMMDGSFGDHNIFSKLMLGWVEPVFVTSDTELTLAPASSSEVKAVIITPDENPSVFSEYYMLELYNNDGNNSKSLTCEGGDVRVYHVNAQAEKSDEEDVYYLKYNNTYEDQSEYRLIKLLEANGNEHNSLTGNLITADKYYYTGMTFGVNTAPSSEFYEGVYTGINISFDEVNAENAKVTVTFEDTDTQKPQVQSDYIWNIMGKAMSLSEYTLYFDSYIYEGDNFNSIKCYKKDTPDELIEVEAYIVNPRTRVGFSDPIFPDSNSNYNILELKISGEMEYGAEYVVELPEGTIKDAYGNTNDLIIRNIETVEVTDNVTYKDYDLKSLPEAAPEDYIASNSSSIQYMQLSDGNKLFSIAGYYMGDYYSGNNTEEDEVSAPAAMLIFKIYSDNDEQLLNKALLLKDEWSYNQHIKEVFELDNGNICFIYDREYVVVDKEGNIVSEILFEDFVTNLIEGCGWVERDDCYDVYNDFFEERVVYRINKADGSCEKLTKFTEEATHRKDLKYCNKDYTSLDWNSYYKEVYNHYNDYYYANLSFDCTNSGITPLYTLSTLPSISLSDFNGKDTIWVTSFDHFARQGISSMGKVDRSIQVVDKDYYKMLDIKVSQMNHILPGGDLIEIDGGDGYLLGINAMEANGNGTYHSIGSYILRLDSDYNVKWISFITDTSGIIEYASYYNGKITIVVPSDVIEFEDVDTTYISAEKSFSFAGDNIVVYEDKHKLLTWTDMTVKDVKECLSGTYSNVEFYDSTMQKVTDENSSMLDGLVAIQSVDGWYRWYYKVQTLKFTTDDNIYIEFNGKQSNNDITASSYMLEEDSEEYQELKIADRMLNVQEGNVTLVYAYNISVVDMDNNAYKPDNSATVKIPHPDNYGPKDYKVYRYNNDDDTLTDMQAELVDGKLQFTTDCFGTFIVTQLDLSLEVPKDIFYGDANSDGEVSGKDAVIFKRYLAGYDVTINVDAMDVNGDCNVNGKDAVILMKYLAGYDVVLGGE